jgi:hypothetical protein
MVIGRVESVGLCCPREFDETYENTLKVILRVWDAQILHSPVIKEKYTDGETAIEAWKKTLMHVEMPTEGPQSQGFRNLIEKNMERMRMVYDVLMGRRQLGSGSIPTGDEVSSEGKDRYVFELATRLSAHRLFVIKDGGIGLTRSGSSADVRRDDAICLVTGCSLPLVLRPEGAHFRLLCSCCVDRYGNLDARNKALLDSRL